jgi:hypothetical protein
MGAFPQTADLWRFVTQPAGGRRLQVARPRVPVLIIPISSFDALPSFARESTHVAFLPPRLRDLRKDDELRTGRRTDVDGNVTQYRFTIDGIRRYRFGLRHTEAFLRERE